MSPKLIYFRNRGYAESIRYMLHYGGIKFEDVRYDGKDWPELKDSTPYGQIPLYEENGQTLNQSIAIARYVASQVGLLPSDPWEQAKLDAAVLNIYDFIKKFLDHIKEQDPVKKEANKKTFDESKPFFLSRFENELKAGNGHFGEKLSWADFILVGAVEFMDVFVSETIYPTITALTSEIHVLPGVKEYIANREP